MKQLQGVLAVCLFLADLSTSAVVLAQPAEYKGPVAQAPKWTWKRLVLLYGYAKQEHKVDMIREENGLYVTTPFPKYPACEKCLTLLSTDGVIHKVTDLEGKELEAFRYATSGYQPVNYPLWVGKTWEFDFTWDDGGKLTKYHNMMKVVSYEAIKIAAGELKVFKIEDKIAKVDGTWSDIRYSYYSPDTGIVVKHVGFKNHRWELKSME